MFDRVLIFKKGENYKVVKEFYYGDTDEFEHQTVDICKSEAEAEGLADIVSNGAKEIVKKY